MSSKTLYIVIVLSLILSVLPHAQADEVAKYLSTITVPEPIKRVHPKYPLDAVRQGREGWAIFSFVIDEEGKVKDVILKDSSGSADITKAAKKAVKKWRYKPAFENGKAIPQCVNTVQLDFKMGKGRTTGTSRSFISKYTKAQEALKTENYTEVETILESMNKNRKMHLSENNYMHLLSAEYAKTQNDKESRLFHLSRVSTNNTSHNEKQKMAMLYQIFVLEIELQKYQYAYNTYEQLISLEAAKPYLPALEKTINKVNSVINGNKNIVIQANLEEKEHWYIPLVRSEFSIREIEGALHTLDVRCANKRHVYTIKQNNTWKLPSKWDSCSIYVYGEPKTTFKLVEHPFTI